MEPNRYRCPICLREFAEGDSRCGHDSTLLLVTEVAPNVRPAAPADPLVGTIVDGKYRLDALLGRGGMGVVYLATHLQLDRAVAIKIMLESVLAMAGGFERFQREARAIARLKHGNIVMIHDFGGAPDVGAYLVMEHLEGRTLRQIVADRGMLTVELSIAIMRQVCSAVQAAHGAGILHRDLKSENIFLEGAHDDVAHVKVLDFGIAKLLVTSERAGQNLTEEGAIIGTPGYMSPEQAAGGRADVRSDVYSLGCILYEMLTGRLPFVAQSIPALLQMHLMEDPVVPSATAPSVPPELDAVVLRTLAKWPENRYQSARELDEALAAVPPVRARKGRTSPLSTEAVPGALAGDEIVADEALESIAILPFTAIDGDAGAEMVGEGIAESLATSLAALPRVRVTRPIERPVGEGTAEDPVAAGRALDVAGVLTGRVGAQGERISVAVEYYEVESGWHLWGLQYTCPVSNLPELRQELLRDIVKKLRL
jgi:TolB-like protein